MCTREAKCGPESIVMRGVYRAYIRGAMCRLSGQTRCKEEVSATTSVELSGAKVNSQNFTKPIEVDF
jgi:hypothetical protein